MENVDVGARVPLLLLRTSTRFCGSGTAGGSSICACILWCRVGYVLSRACET